MSKTEMIQPGDGGQSAAHGDAPRRPRRGVTSEGPHLGTTNRTAAYSRQSGPPLC